MNATESRFSALGGRKGFVGMNVPALAKDKEVQGTVYVIEAERELTEPERMVARGRVDV